MKTVERKLIVQNLQELEQLASRLSKHLKPGFVLGLGGELGSGKTTFTKYLAKYMGICENVNSPTFTLLKVYKNALPLYHMDVYRLETIGHDYELDDYIYGKGVAVIEWYSFIEKMLPEQMLIMDITAISETKREIVLKGSGDYEHIVKDLVD
jgi:tRNA threonylcarbamoyladenosine biosynthesis protein TsaE